MIFDFLSADKLTQNNVRNLINSFLFDITYYTVNYPLESVKIKTLLDCSSILCIGCGPGRHINFLRKWYSIVAVENRDKLFDIAQNTFPEIKIYKEYPDDKFDAVIFLLDSINFDIDLMQVISSALKCSKKYILIASNFYFEEHIKKKLYTPFLEEISADYEQTMEKEGNKIKINRKYTVHYFGQSDIMEENLVRYIFDDEEYLRVFRKNGLTFMKDDNFIIGKKKII